MMPRVLLIGFQYLLHCAELQPLKQVYQFAFGAVQVQVMPEG
jgi:hypothetical protein